jgi:uncharacterized protein (UPF0332 family)
MLADARKATEVSISKATVVNRLNYACFHAAQTALYARGFVPESHEAVQTLLGRELIKPGEVGREFGRFYDGLETFRRRTDYGSGPIERETDAHVSETVAFLAAMTDIVE